MLASHGRVGLANLIDRTCEHAARLASLLAAGGAEVLAPVVMGQLLVAFGSDASPMPSSPRPRPGTCTGAAPVPDQMSSSRGFGPELFQRDRRTSPPQLELRGHVAGTGPTGRQGERAARRARLPGVPASRRRARDSGFAGRECEPSAGAPGGRRRHSRGLLRDEHMDCDPGVLDGVHQRQGRAPDGRPESSLRRHGSAGGGLAERHRR